MIANLTRLLALALVIMWVYPVVNMGASAPIMLCAVAIAFLAIKYTISIGGFALSAWANRGDPVGFKLHPMRLIYGFFEEGWATTRGVLWLMPWKVLQRLPAPSRPQRNRLPVLLIHGFVCNRGYWIPAAQLLIKKGFFAEAITLEPAFGSIDDYSKIIADAVAQLKLRSGQSQVVLVCHSMGGLAARAYLRRYGDAQVRHVITLGTPHHGTVLANLAIGENAQQMKRENAWRATLAQGESPALCAKFTTIYSRIDNIVAPARAAVLAGAKEIELIDVGHVAMAFAPRCLNMMIEEIERVSLVK